MEFCVNISHPDFIKLVEQSGLKSSDLASKMSSWMEFNLTDEWPSLEQLGINQETELSSKLLSFLNSLNFSVDFKDDLKELSGYDVNSLTDLLYKTILIKDNYKDKGLLKESAYVAYTLLGKKNKIRTDLTHNIEQLDNYKEIFSQYKKRSPNLSESKIKELIIIDFIADAINNNFEIPKDSYQNRKAEYWSIKADSNLERELKYILSKIRQFLEELFKTVKLSKEEVNSLLDDIAHSVLTNNFDKFGSVLTESQQLTNYERTISSDPKAEEIIKSMQDLGLLLTGSLSLRKQGTLYREVSEDLHDLDFTLSFNKHGDYFYDLISKMSEQLEGASKTGEGFIYDSFLKKLSSEYKKHPIINKIKEKYPSFEITTAFSASNNKKEVTVTGKIDNYIIDLFFVTDDKLDVYEKSFQDWEPIFKAKLRMARHKDIRDFVNYIPFNTKSNKVAQHKGLRHFNFVNIVKTTVNKEIKLSDNEKYGGELNNFNNREVWEVEKKYQKELYDWQIVPGQRWPDNSQKYNKIPIPHTKKWADEFAKKIVKENSHVTVKAIAINPVGNKRTVYYTVRIFYPLDKVIPFKEKESIVSRISDIEQSKIESSLFRIKKVIKKENHIIYPNVKAIDLLKDLLKEVKYLNPETKKIIKLIIESEGRGNKTQVVISDPSGFKSPDAVMGFDQVRGVIKINYSLITSKDRYKDFDDFVTTLTHELVHTLTLRGLREDKIFYNKINKLFEELKKDRSELGLSGEELDYAFTDPEEFVAEFFTNDSLINHIKEIDRLKGKNILQQLLDWIFYHITGKHMFKGIYEKTSDYILNFISTETRFTTNVGTEAHKEINLSNREAVKDKFKELATLVTKNVKEAKGTKESYTAVTTLMKLNKLGFSAEDNDDENIKKAQGIGSATHLAANDFIDDKITDIEKETGYKISDDARSSLEAILERFKTPNSTALSEVLVAEFNAKIQAKIDLIFIDAKNDTHIVDFKVKLAGFGNYEEDYVTSAAYLNPNDKKYKKPYSSKKYAHLQLSAYKVILQRSTGIIAKTMNVVMLKPEVVGNEIVNFVLDISHPNYPKGVDSFTGISQDITYVIPVGLTKTKEGKTKVKSKLEEDYASNEEERILEEQTIRDALTELKLPSKLKELSDNVIASLKIRRDALMGGKYQSDLAEKYISQLLREKDLNQRMILLIGYAANTVNSRLKEYQKLVKNGTVPDKVTLARWKESVSAYDSLDDYASYLRITGTKLKEEEINYNKLLETVIKTKNDIKNLYKMYGEDMLVEGLSPYFGEIHQARILELRRNYKKLPESARMGLTVDEYVDQTVYETEKGSLEEQTKQLIKNELQTARSDVSYIYRWLDNILDSKDPVVAAMIKKFAIVHEQSRMASLEKRTELLHIVEELEKFNKNTLLTDMSKYYDFLLETIDGEKTGHYITPFKSTALNDYRALTKLLKSYDYNGKDEILVLGLKKAWKDGLISLKSEGLLELVQEELKRQEKLIKEGKTAELEFKDEESKEKVDPLTILKQFTADGNVPMDNEELNKEAKEKSGEKLIYFNEAIDNFITDANAEGLITNQELLELGYNSKLSLRDRKSNLALVSEGHIRESVSNLISNWIFDNAWNYRVPSKKYENPQWDDGKGNGLKYLLENKEDPRTKFYNYIVKMGHDSDRKLYSKDRLGTRLPGVVKQWTERFTEGQSPITMFQQSAGQALTFTQQDIDRGVYQLRDVKGNVKYRLPVHYTNQPNIKDQSFDIPTIYMKFWDMANDHQLKSQILPEMELTQFFLDERMVTKKIDSKGRKVLKKGGFIAEQFHDFMLMAVYGEYKAEGSHFTIGNKIYSVEKILDMINSYSALNLLGLNFIQGFANVMLGESLQKIEALAGQYVTPKSFMKASLMYDKNLPGILGDIGKRVPTNIVSLLNEEFDTLNEPIDTIYRENTWFAKMMKSNSLFFTSHAGEHFMQTRFMLAYLMNQKAYNSKGEVIGTIFDFYKKDKKGGLVFDPEGKVDRKLSKWQDGKDKNGNPDGSTNDIMRVKIKLKGILSRLHGEYGELGMVAIQRYAIGRMGYTFRKFVLPGWKRRWESYGYIERIEEFTEGNYRTTGRFFAQLIKDGELFKLALWGEKYDDLTPMEKANIVRTVSELALLLTTFILIGLFTKLDGDDDEEQSQLQSFLLYQLYRYRAELTFFVWPGSAVQIMRSPMASLSTIENLGELMSQFISDPLERYEKGPNKDKLKVYKEFRDMVIGARQFYRMQTMANTVNWFKN